MKKRVVITILFIISLFLLNFVLAEEISEDLHLNLQTTNGTGTVVTGTFSFVFNISTTDDCANVIYTNSTSLTTDVRGIISYYLSNVSLNYSQQYYLCYYRDGVLKDSTKIVRSPYSFRARNITSGGIEVDSNLDLGAYNMTAYYYFGNGAYLTEVNDTLSQLNCLNEQVVKWNATSTIWYCSDVSAAGAGDIDAVNTDDIYLTGGQTTGTVNLVFNETKLNETIDYRILTNNESIVNWVTSIFVQISNIVNMVGNWSVDKVNYYNTTQVDEINTSMKNYVDEQNTSLVNYIGVVNDSVTNYIESNNISVTNAINAVAAAGEPLWSANYTAFNETWSSTFNQTTNDSVTNYIESNNVSVTNAINAVAAAGELLWSANYTAFNETWSSTFNQTTNDSINNYISANNGSLVNYIGVVNTSMKNYVDDSFLRKDGDNGTGQYDFNGGWTSNGLSIIGGNLYAQTGYFYNISSLLVTNLNINGSLLPYEGEGFDNQFDIGSASSRWKDLYLGGDANISGTLYVAGVNISANNDSVTNYIESNNVSVTNAINAVAAAGELLWSANYTAFNETWSSTFNQTTNDSINNYISANNGSLVNYIGIQNTSLVNYIGVVNDSVTNYIESNNISVTNALATKLALAGGNMTGNLNMTATNNITMGSGQKTCYTWDCSKYIMYNGTALIIQG